MILFSLFLLGSDGLSDLDPSYVRDALIILACFVGLAIAILTLVEKIKGRGATDVKVSPTPVPIRQVYDHPTREEFNDLKVEVKAMEKALPEMERRILQSLREIGKETREAIESVAEKAYQGRKGLHKSVNEHQAEIASLKAKVNKS